MVAIRFDQSSIVLPIEDMSDSCIEEARLEAERQEGVLLEIDPKTNFPSFTVYLNGAILGGG